MKELHFTYRMRLSFDPPVEQHRFTLKCVPHSDARQEITALTTDVYPKEFLSDDTDAFGNHCIYGYSAGQHDHFSVEVTGRARTGLSPFTPAPPAHQLGLFKYQTAITAPGEALTAFAAQFSFPADMGALDRACAFMDGLHDRFVYTPGVTDIHTTAEQAMALGQGVCQDYAHILLSLCRMEQIPCRYVVGMLLGEGLSHAWVEIADGERWYALDPTNRLLVDDQHIKISAGRDYTDCTINQGLFVGRTRQTQQAVVSVQEEKKP